MQNLVRNWWSLAWSKIRELLQNPKQKVYEVYDLSPLALTAS